MSLVGGHWTDLRLYERLLTMGDRHSRCTELGHGHGLRLNTPTGFDVWTGAIKAGRKKMVRPSRNVFTS